MTLSAQHSWIELGVPALVLAPMEGVADVAMRALLSELGGFTFCVAEFFRISQSVPGSRAIQRHVPELMQGARTPTGLPVQVQLLGGDPDKLAKAALVAVQAGARAVDLNFGCPARTVNRHDGGATLLQHPDRIREIVAEVRTAVPSPSGSATDCIPPPARWYGTLTNFVPALPGDPVAVNAKDRRRRGHGRR